MLEADYFRSDDYRTKSDVSHFQRLGAEDGVPYRDFESAYPPVTYVASKLLHSSDFDMVLERLIVSQLVLDLGCAALVGFGWGRRAVASYLLVALPLLRLELVRLDFVPVFLAILGLFLVRRLAERAGGIVVAVAALAKLWPAALVPVLWGAGRRRAAVSAVVAGGAGLGAWLVVGGFEGVRQVIGFRGARGWQVESLPGTLLLLVRGGEVRYELGAYRVGAPPSWVGWCFLAAAAAAVLGAALALDRARRRGASIEPAGTPAVVAISAMMVGATILSPQFLIWLVPFAAIAAVDGDHRSEVLVAAAVGLTSLVLVGYDPVDSHLAVPQTAYLLRNGLLVAVIVVGLRRLYAAARRDPLPAAT